MVHWWRVTVKADFENIIVVRGDAETRHEAVNVKVKVLAIHVLTFVERLAVGRRTEQ